MNNKNIFAYKAIILLLFITASSLQAMLNRLFSPSLQRSAFHRLQQRRSYMSTNESPSFWGFVKDWWHGKYERQKAQRLASENLATAEQHLTRSELADLDKETQHIIDKIKMKQQIRDTEDRVKSYLRR